MSDQLAQMLSNLSVEERRRLQNYNPLERTYKMLEEMNKGKDIDAGVAAQCAACFQMPQGKAMRCSACKAVIYCSAAVRSLSLDEACFS
jgi:hypothetical protein